MATTRPSAGIYKSAVLLASLGTDLAARVLSHMPDRDVETIIAQMAEIGHIRTCERDEVLAEFDSRLQEDPEGLTAGPEYARRLLEQAVGPEKAGELLGERPASNHDGPTLETILESTPPASLAALVEDEHPQVIALLAGQLTADRAAVFLAALP